MNKPAQAPKVNNTRTVATNSLWYGAETLGGIVLLFATTIPLARVMGPEKLGYFTFVSGLTAMSATLGNLGIPGMCGKFMAEYLGRGEEGVARAIFFAGMRVHVALAFAVTLISLLIAAIWGDPQYRTVTILQVLSVLPGMLVALPSLANVAAERMRNNVPGSMASSVIYLIGVLLSLWLGWGLVGVAASFLAGRTVELAMKMIPCLRWMNRLPQGEVSKPLLKQMRQFAEQQLWLLIMGLIIWDRSDVILLKMLSPDIKQITFFNIAYNLSDRALLAPRVFGSAVTASLMAQYGRSNEQMNQMAAAATRYMFLLGTPLLTGLALVSPSVIRVYGVQYIPAIPVLAVGALFALIKSVMDPADSILRAYNRQKPAVVATLFCAAANIGLDWLLIPHYGALGAAYGNGIAQALRVFSYWGICLVLFRVPLDYKGIGKILLASAAMAPPVLFLNSVLPPFAALFAGVAAGSIVFLAMLRLTRFFDPQDRVRIEHLTKSIPARVRPALETTLQFVMPAATASTSA